MVFLVEGKTTPSSRLRVTAHLPAIRHAGFVVETVDIPRSPIARIKRFLGLGRFDVVVVQKKVLRNWEVALLARRAPRLVYDFDDAVMVGPYGERPDPRRSARFVEMVARCDAVIAGNEELARYAVGHPNVRVIPTGLDPAAYHVKSPTTADGRATGVVIGWIGTRGNLRYLDELAPVFRSLAARGLQITLRVVSDATPGPSAIPIEYVPWRLDREAEDLAAFDIGVMPLDDTAWSRGKCGFKLLQYMAAGLPAVASPVGMNRSIIRHGENGYLAKTPDEWGTALSRLIEGPSLRAWLGQAARRTVETEYSLARCSDAFVAVLRDACDAQPTGMPSAAGSKHAVNG